MLRHTGDGAKLSSRYIFVWVHQKIGSKSFFVSCFVNSPSKLSSISTMDADTIALAELSHQFYVRNVAMQKRKPKTSLKLCPKPPSTPPTIAQRARQSNRPTSAPSITGSSTDSVSQHSTATTSLLSADAGFVDDSDVSQPAGSEVVTDVSEQLVRGVLIKVMGDVTTIVARAHSHIDKKRCAFNQAREEEMSSKFFGPTIDSLQRAYVQLMCENFENQWCSEIAGDVRDLAETIVWKLSMNARDATKEGPALLINMLELQRVIFKWDKNLEILEAAVEIARVEKANASQLAKTCQDNLRNMTHT